MVFDGTDFQNLGGEFGPFTPGGPMRRRLRKKWHRKFLNTVCVWDVTFDEELRSRLLGSSSATPFRIEGKSSANIQRLIRSHRLKYWVTLVRKLASGTAVVAFWAQEFPRINDSVVIFSTDDFGPGNGIGQGNVEPELRKASAEEGAPVDETNKQ